jgi:hypothetical protein
MTKKEKRANTGIIARPLTGGPVAVLNSPGMPG